MSPTSSAPTATVDDRHGRRSLRDRGASLVEYALVVALIALVCIGAVTYFGESTSSSFDRSTDSIFVP